MARQKNSNPKILMVMNGPPWSTWTMSGVSKGVCGALLEKGALYGAVSHRCSSNRNFSKPSIFYKGGEFFYKLKGRIFEQSIQSWRSESSEGLAEILDQAPKSTAVIYTYVNPKYGASTNVRRFRWIGISVLDAARHEAYGHENMDDEALKEKYQKQHETIHRSEAIFTHSSYGADSIARDFDYPRENIYPIGAGASIQFKGAKNTSIERYRRSNILFIGRDWERKGGPLAYKAFMLLKEKIPHATLTIVGPTKQPVFGEGVIFEGFLRKHKYLENRKLKKLYLKASLFCTPSVCETWGLVYVEAAASGLPVVGTNEWAMPDIVINGKTGVLTQGRSPEVLAKAMYQVLKNPDEAKKMGDAAIIHVDDVLDWPNVADRIIAAISPEILENRRPNWLPEDIDRPEIV
jgi:glycosyltransferase involved in cell wall biosynthesis